MKEKIKILIVPSLNDNYNARKLGNKLAEMGYEIKLVDRAFDEICGLQMLSQNEYLGWKPDLVVATGMGCIVIGTFVNAIRVMINPDFHYSDFCKKWVRDREERIKNGMYEGSVLDEVKRACEDAEYDAGIAENLESKEMSKTGSKPILGIFTYESEEMAAYQERYGVYELNPSLDLSNSASLDQLASRIDQFLKDNPSI